MRKWLPLNLLWLHTPYIFKEAGLERSHREGLVAFVVTEVLTEASRLQTASKVSGAQAYTNQQVWMNLARKLVELLYILIVVNQWRIYTRAYPGIGPG